MLDLVLASVCVCVLVCVGVSSAHFKHFHFQRSQPASHREVPFHRFAINILSSTESKSWVIALVGKEWSYSGGGGFGGVQGYSSKGKELIPVVLLVSAIGSDELF